jgi:hypothetical protein
MRAMRYLFIALILAVNFSNATAEEIVKGGKRIGIVYFHNGDQLDGYAKRQVDSLAPMLKKLSIEQSIKIEGFSVRGNGKEEKIKNSMQIAQEVANYISNKHRLKGVLNVSVVNDNNASNNKSFVRILSLANDYNFEQVEIIRKLTDDKR